MAGHAPESARIAAITTHLAYFPINSIPQATSTGRYAGSANAERRRMEEAESRRRQGRRIAPSLPA